MRIVRLLLTGLLVDATLVTLGGPVGALGLSSAAPTGDRATIAYYTSVTNNFNNRPGDVQISRGAFFLGYRSATNWYLSWNVARPQYSWQQPVQETNFFAVAHHKIVWDTVKWTPACSSGKICVSTLVPLEFFSERGATYWAYLNGPHATPLCWNPATSSTAWINQNFNSTGVQPWYAGASPFTTPPNYSPLVRRGHVVTITSTYRYRRGAGVKEIDTINAGTQLFTQSAVHVEPHGSVPGYSFTTAISLGSPKLPRIVLCRLGGNLG